VTAGSEFTLHLTVRNAGATPAANVVVTDSFLRAGFVSASGGNGFVCQPTYFTLKGGMQGALNGVRCSGGSLAPGDVTTIDVTLTANSAPGTWLYIGLVDPSNAIAESNELNNLTSGAVTVQ
jgi:uncharacterized repeat protein (TIGR01451 family)